MVFNDICFIKPNVPFEHDYLKEDYAPMFRKKFNVSESFKAAKLYVCGLGYGYYWMNGKKVSDDLFTAPVSNYTKTLWYNTYDVTELLINGENIFAIICGNGWYNESFPSSWDYDDAEWRDNPKFILRLEIDGKTILASDEGWKCKPKSAIAFNQLRSGEYFDARLYNENWNKLNFDDSSWNFATIDTTPPTGVFRECLCEPIRECEFYPAKEIIKVNEGKYIFDMGQNISGYIRLKIRQKSGDSVTIRYAEQINENNTLNLNEMERHYPSSDFQMDKFICNGKDFVWSPIFVYHGFRYIELSGVENPTLDMVSGVFVHQDIKSRSSFECSDKFLNKLFKIGQMATWSNLFYIPTDCPTREKLGWTNDAQASADQMLTNFETEKLFEKWMVDIRDAMRDDGGLPGTIPTSGWGYLWGNGPVSDGVLFEIPYQVYLHTGNSDLLCDNFPYFKRYLTFLNNKANEDGLVSFGLDDWATPSAVKNVPVEFINAVLQIKFLKIACLSAKLNNVYSEEFEKVLGRVKNIIFKKYIDANGYCIVNEQTSVAMLIYHKLYERLDPLKEQLKKLIEENNFHHNCGMVGLRHLYIALNECGLQEYAYKIITAKGYPSYSNWIDGGATTLWEFWKTGGSKNHHMYSDYMSWIIKTIVGINPVLSHAGFKEVLISPYFFSSLDFAKGYCNTVSGRISVEWKRENKQVSLKIKIPEGISAKYCDRILHAGINEFVMLSE